MINFALDFYSKTKFTMTSCRLTKWLNVDSKLQKIWSRTVVDPHILTWRIKPAQGPWVVQVISSSPWRVALSSDMTSASANMIFQVLFDAVSRDLCACMSVSLRLGTLGLVRKMGSKLFPQVWELEKHKGSKVLDNQSHLFKHCTKMHKNAWQKSALSPVGLLKAMLELLQIFSSREGRKFGTW